MEITKGIQTDQEYFWKRTDSWDWFGTPRWWEVFVEFYGFNGGCGAWVKERWRWNGSSQTISEQIRTLSFEETEELIREIKQANTGESRKEKING